METVNNILLAETIQKKVLFRGPPTAKHQKDKGEAQRQAELDTRQLRQSCVLLLHSMLEGQKKGGRVLKKLEELNAGRVREEVVKIYQVRPSTCMHEG